MKDMSISHLQEKKKIKIKSYAKIGESIAAETRLLFILSNRSYDTKLSWRIWWDTPKTGYSELHLKLEILSCDTRKTGGIIYDTRLFEIPIEYSVICRS